MQISSSTFSDPTMRSALQQYYEDSKSAALEAWKARADTVSRDVTFTNADGQTVHGKTIVLSPEQLEKAFVSFDEWLGTMAEISDQQTKSLEFAQQRMAQLEENNPSNSSGVRATFSNKGVLLAYVNENGTLVTSNGTEGYLAGIGQKADDLGLTGEARIDYLNHAVEDVLSRYYPSLGVEDYSSGDSPSYRDFAASWYNNYDADAMYDAAISDAQAQLDDARAWQTRMQTNFYRIQDYLLQMQTSAS